MKKLLSLAVIAVFSAFCAVSAPAADKKPDPTEKGEKKAATHIPFHGKIDGLDKAAKTIKVGERTFHLTSTTKVMKAGKLAAFDDAKSGDEVGGTYHEGAGGKLELLSLRVGPKPEKPSKEDKK